MMDEFDESNVIYGQAYKKLPGDYPEGTRIYAMDDNGKIAEVATLDKIGKFQFESLAKEGSYFFRLEEDDQLATFVLLDKFGNVIQTPDKAGEIWVFDRLANDKYSLATIDEDDSSLDKDRFNTELPKTTYSQSDSGNVIYFDHKSSSLSGEDSLKLWSVVKAMRADDGKYFKINSHTDQSESRSNRSFSALRSVAIVQYLEARGISTDRIYVQNWENDKPKVDCPEGTPCGKEEREQNQRSEYSIVGIDEWPTIPDYIISYEFNQWKLPEDADDQLFGAIKKLKADPAKKVVLDGYADTWGTYSANQRISQLRAINIKNTMEKYGIDESRVDIIWHGESVPFGGCLLYYPCPVEDRKQNRRVEIRIEK
ncbi:OmpA family protein [Salibacteraceae bacterium]|nr:OmpA family protein [Salibacteraceae bacterium]